MKYSESHSPLVRVCWRLRERFLALLFVFYFEEINALSEIDRERQDSLRCSDNNAFYTEYILFFFKIFMATFFTIFTYCSLYRKDLTRSIEKKYSIEAKSNIRKDLFLEFLSPL
jgi:hypothetical protein